MLKTLGNSYGAGWLRRVSLIHSSAVGIEDEERKCFRLRRLKTKTCESLGHPFGEGELEFKFFHGGDTDLISRIF
jgi:hypothetical protein